MRTAITLLALAALATAIVVWRAEASWTAATQDLERRLRSQAARSGAAVYREADVSGLPEPVARYFRVALRDGQPIVTRARVSWRGEFNTGQPGKAAWKPFTATQEFVPGAPGFVWNARISMAPGLPVLVRDGFVDGAGSMRGALFGLVRVVDVAGTPAIAAGALQRYLAEAAWFPTALLPGQGVAWTAIDDTRARATLTAGAISVSLEFRFGGDGLIASVFAADRFYDDGRHPPVARPWLGRNLRYEERHGMKLPAAAEVEWQLPEGVFPYWRGQPLAIEYELASP